VVETKPIITSANSSSAQDITLTTVMKEAKLETIAPTPTPTTAPIITEIATENVSAPLKESESVMTVPSPALRDPPLSESTLSPSTDELKPSAESTATGPSTKFEMLPVSEKLEKPAPVLELVYTGTSLILLSAYETPEATREEESMVVGLVESTSEVDKAWSCFSVLRFC
jgi:hypothetical protein